MRLGKFSVEIPQGRELFTFSLDGYETDQPRPLTQVSTPVPPPLLL